MATPTFGYAIEPLNTQRDRSGFSCGIESLDRYLLKQAGQDLRRRVAAPFVLQDLVSFLARLGINSQANSPSLL